MAALIDANVSIYAAGRPHAYREPSLQVLLLATQSPGSCWTTAEVLQEVYHTYSRRGERDRGRQLVTDLDIAVSGNVAAVLREDVLVAIESALPHSLQARDRVHLAVMARLGITGIISTDRAFDGLDRIRRLDPLRLADWRDEVFS